MSEWRRVKLGDLGRVVTGATPPTKKPEYYDGNYQFVTPSDLVYDTWGVSKTERTISDEGRQKYLTRCVPAGAVMYTCIASIGKIGVAKDTVLTNQQINSIIANDENDGRFIYHLLRYNTDRIRGLNAGCAVPIINKTDFENIEVSAPPLPTQRRIADILSAYDDKIANNRRRMELLEESARLLYRKMFGDGTSGTVGTKWDVKRMEEVCETIGGGTPKTSVAEYWNGDIMWVVPTDVTRNTGLPLLNTERKITALGLQKSSAKMLPPRTILMTSRASIGYFGVCDQAVCTNQGFISVIPNAENMRWYFLYNLLSRVEEIRGYAKGATFAEISKSQFRSMGIVVPDNEALNTFAKFAENVYQQTLRLSRQNAKLAEARDILLSQLMSGKMEVS